MTFTFYFFFFNVKTVFRFSRPLPYFLFFFRLKPFLNEKSQVLSDSSRVEESGG